MLTRAFSKIWIIIIILIIGGILAWQYFGMQKEEVGVPEEKAAGKILNLYPRSAELFQVCFTGYRSPEEQDVKEISQGYGVSEEEAKRFLEELSAIYVVSEEEVAKAFESTKEEKVFGKKIVSLNDLEDTLKKGFIKEKEEGLLYGIFGWGGIRFLCQKNLTEENLRPQIYNKVCQEKPSCCNLPEPKDIDSINELAKRLSECIEPNFKIEEIEKLKYGYFIRDGWAHVEAVPFSYYLSDTGCLINCYFPYLAIAAIKQPLIQKKISEFAFENLPEEIKTKVIEFENKIVSLYEKAILEKNAELCEEYKREVEKVEAVSKEKKPGDWEFEAMRRNDLAYTYDNEYEACIKIIAVKLNDESLCDRMPSSKSCRKDLFLQYTGLCPEISVDIASRAEHCKRAGWGVTEKEWAICSQEIEKIRKKEECIKKVALETRNIELCKKILDKDCQNELAIKLNKPEECTRSSCYQAIAIGYNNPELCKKVSNEAFCVTKVGYKKDGLMGWKLCDKYFGLTQDYERESFYSYFGTEAGKEGNVRVCEWIPVGKGSCKLEVARRTNNVELCGTNQKCIKEIAVNTKDPKLCRKLNPNYSHWEECYQELGLEPIHGFLGVITATINPALRDIMELPVDYGALVKDLVYGKSPIFPNSSAEKAGIKEGDIILEADGQKINQDNPLGEIMIRCIAGDKVSLKILREGKQKEVKATLGSFPLEKYKEETAEKSVEELLEEQKELSDWRTFRDERYGYEIKYPASCYYQPLIAGGDYYSPYSQFKCPIDLCYSVKFEEIIFEKVKWEEFPELVKKMGRFPLSISIHHGFSRIAGLQNRRLKTDLKGEEIKIQETVEETLPKNLTLSFYESAIYPGEGEEEIIIQWTKKDDLSKLCEIEMRYKDETDKRLEIYNQMLSTFRFLE